MKIGHSQRKQTTTKPQTLLWRLNLFCISIDFRTSEVPIPSSPGVKIQIAGRTSSPDDFEVGHLGWKCLFFLWGVNCDNIVNRSHVTTIVAAAPQLPRPSRLKPTSEAFDSAAEIGNSCTCLWLWGTLVKWQWKYRAFVKWIYQTLGPKAWANQLV